MGNCYNTSLHKQLLKKPNRISKFIIFGQDRTGKPFFLYYDPQSKQLKPTTLPQNPNFYNYSATTMKNSTTMIVCGGIKHNLRNITNTAFEYDFITHTCKALPPMKNIRYTFPILHKDNFIYVIGGRTYGDDFNSLLDKCERFDYRTKRWRDIAKLNVKRCTCSLFVYKEVIWVIGGYTGRFKRSKKIERYLEDLDVWEVLDFKLFYGFENGNVVAGNREDEVIVLGGKLNFGFSKNVWEYNLREKTVLNKRCLLKKSVLTKYHVFGDEAVILSEDVVGGKSFFYCETYNKKTFKTKLDQLVINRKNLEKFKQYNFSNPNIYIKSSTNPCPPSQIDYKHKNIIFGTDDEPFQLNICSKTGLTKLLPIPTNLKLHNLQGCTRINQNQIFLCGGIKANLRKIESLSLLYNLQTKKVQKLTKMHKIRYSFSCKKHKNNIYAIGGRVYGNAQNAIINDCERYNLENKKWEYLSGLNIARSASSAIVYRGRLFVFGGSVKSENSQKSDFIEVFDERSLGWDVLGVRMPLGLSSLNLVCDRNRVFFFGGMGKREEKGKYCVDLRLGDLGEFRKMGDLPFKTFKHFVLRVRGDFIVFGGLIGSKRKRFCILDGKTLRNKVNFSHNSYDYDTRSGEESGESYSTYLNFYNFSVELSKQIHIASSSKNLMERNSFVMDYKVE